MTECRHLRDVGECGDCNRHARFLPPPAYGPWAEAHYPGDCAGCGYRIVPGDQIRSDGDGGWLCVICGDRGTGTKTVQVSREYL